MEDVVVQAKRLGESIASHESCKALKAAVGALQADEEAKSLEKNYAEIAQTLEAKGKTGQPIEPDEKRREAELRSKMAAHPAIREFLKAQADFYQVMHEVNKAIEEAIGIER
ncbi:MAG: YlbF/YmcA family competence regulator [Planctomycetota bacterium]|jgi:cell fate (sporulation/competence/biofilm development) regulator YlbF (YheA/YmcA/DUF963 family)